MSLTCSRSIWSALTLAVMVLDASPPTALAQSNGPIEVTPILTLGDTGGDGTLSGAAFVSARHPRGRVVTTPWGNPNVPALFDSMGNFVHLLGATGAGPGEFRRPQAMVVSGDSLFIMDNVLRRGTVFDASLRLARSFSIPENIWSILELTDGTFLASTGVFALREPFSHLSREGELIGRVGEVPSVQGNPINLMAQAGDGTIWAARGGERLELTQYDRRLQRVGGFAPTRAWFPESRPGRKRSVDDPPSAGVRGLWLDSSGRLWVLGIAADSEWKEGMGPERVGEGGVRYRPIADGRLAFDGIIDVYDAARGTLLASYRVDEPWHDMVEPGIIVRADETEDGWTVLTLWSASWRAPVRPIVR